MVTSADPAGASASDPSSDAGCCGALALGATSGEGAEGSAAQPTDTSRNDAHAARMLIRDRRMVRRYEALCELYETARSAPRPLWRFHLADRPIPTVTEHGCLTYRSCPLRARAGCARAHAPAPADRMRPAGAVHRRVRARGGLGRER